MRRSYRVRVEGKRKGNAVKGQCSVTLDISPCIGPQTEGQSRLISAAARAEGLSRPRRELNESKVASWPARSRPSPKESQRDKEARASKVSR